MKSCNHIGIVICLVIVSNQLIVRKSLFGTMFISRIHSGIMILIRETAIVALRTSSIQQRTFLCVNTPE